MLLPALLLVCSLTPRPTVVLPPDTIPAAFVQALPDDEREAQQVFRQHYQLTAYPRFKGRIRRTGPGTYRLNSFTMRIDTGYTGMSGLLSRGLLHPGIGMVVLGSTDTLTIDNLRELKRIPSMPHTAAVSWSLFGMYSSWLMNGLPRIPEWLPSSRMPY